MEEDSMRLWILLCTLMFETLAWANPASDDFVEVRGKQFYHNHQPYHFLGANFWYGMHLADTGNPVSQARLRRELDRLQELGVTNLRLLAASEGPDGEPIRVRPALQNGPGEYNENLLKGLDVLLVEMRKRQMKAVLVLGNFWEWSGGLGQYLVWSGFADRIPYPPPLDGDFDTYQQFVANFYGNTGARALYEAHLRKIVTRTNSVTGRPYADDPTIMAWQLASEPRAMKHPAAFHEWIDSSSTLIRKLAPRQLITVGAEGDTPHPQYSNSDYFIDHEFPNIDYGTIHIWPENFGWYDPTQAEQTWSGAWKKTLQYIRTHIAKAQALNKPMILEEFGLARDQRSYEASSPVTWRDRYYNMILDEVVRAARSGAPLNAAYFWAWSGEGRPRKPGDLWQNGDPLLGDPPHESQGWYGVYDSDSSTLRILKNFARELQSIRRHQPWVCSDIPPAKAFTCTEQKSWNKCGESWVVGDGYCLTTCDVCYQGVE
jgi:mannan endo-1,4-beta-mannosidase